MDVAGQFSWLLSRHSCQAKLPPAGHVSAEELEQEHRLQWLDSLIKEEEKADVFMTIEIVDFPMKNGGFPHDKL